MAPAEAVAVVRELIIPVQVPALFMPVQPATTMLKIHKMKNKTLGYTLMELLVVISIIGILMGISLVAFQGIRKSGRDARRKADLEQIRSALELCHSTSGSYPESLTTGNPITCGGSIYLQTVPADPLGADYLYAEAVSSYTLCANLEGGAETSSCPSGCAGNYRVCNP